MSTTASLPRLKCAKTTHTPYNLGRLHGQPLRLPAHQHYHPASEQSQWHGTNVFRGREKEMIAKLFAQIDILTSIVKFSDGFE
jgi:hypothetical protein